jgi:hypothetical protein
MPGLAKALKRKNSRRSTKPDPIFDWHTRYGLGLASTPDGQPVLVVMVFCEDEEFARYSEQVRQATSLRLRTVDNALALDLFGPRRPVGRLFASVEDDAAAVILPALADYDADVLEVHLVQATAPTNAEIVKLPAAVDHVTFEEFHGEPVELGEGEYCVTTLSAHDGTIYVHRFETKEEARSQLERNVSANEPFVDANLN